MHPSRRLLAAAVLGASLFVSGCGTLGLGGPSKEERKARCDRLAAQAIESGDFSQASRLAAQASDCYAEEAARGE